MVLSFPRYKRQSKSLSKNFFQILLKSKNDNEYLLCIIHNYMIY